MHTKISLAVDLLLFTISEDKLKLLLIKRNAEPFEGFLALPGVAVSEDERLIDAAKRCLNDKTGIKDEIFMEQLFTWGDDLLRDPRGRVVSVSYYALISPKQYEECKNQLTNDALFYDVDNILSDEVLMAYDHKEIAKYARERVRGKAEYSDIGFSLVDSEFTLPELQRVYEILLDKKLYKANFRKNFESRVEETGNMKKEGACRPSKLYRYI